MTEKAADSASLSGNEQLQLCAERAREAELLLQEAESEANRLRKELKRVRKAYKKAKRDVKAAAKTAGKARTELGSCLEGAFRQLAIALEHDAAMQTKDSGNNILAAKRGFPNGKGRTSSTPGVETHAVEAVRG